MSQKQKLNTRRALRNRSYGEMAATRDARYRLSKRWQRHDEEMRRNTAGCAPDFANLP